VTALKWTSGAVAGGKEENGLLDDDPVPHPAAARTIATTENAAASRKIPLNATPTGSS